MLGKERLTAGFAAAQGKKSNDAGMEIDLSANKPMRPQRIDQEAMPEHGCSAAIVGPANEDDGAGGVRLEIENGVIRHC